MNELPKEALSNKEMIAKYIVALVNGPLSQIKQDLKDGGCTIHIGFNEDFEREQVAGFADKDVLLNAHKQLNFTILVTGLEAGGRDFSAKTNVPTLSSDIRSTELIIHLSHGDLRGFVPEVKIEESDGFKVEISSLFYYTVDRFLTNLSNGVVLKQCSGAEGRNRYHV